MEAIPRNDGEQYRFDAFCKAVLRNEARNYHRNKKRLLDREKSFSVLSLEELGQLTSVDHYPSEEFVCFSLKSGAITTPPQCKRGCLRAMTYRQADTPLPSRSERSERRRQ